MTTLDAAALDAMRKRARAAQERGAGYSRVCKACLGQGDDRSGMAFDCPVCGGSGLIPPVVTFPELAADVLALLAERDTLLARVAELEAENNRRTEYLEWLKAHYPLIAEVHPWEGKVEGKVYKTDGTEPPVNARWAE